MICIRPNITYDVGIVSRFLSNPRNEHWNAVFEGNCQKLFVFWQRKFNLRYLDADVAGDVDLRKSTLVYLISFAEGSFFMTTVTTKVQCFKHHESRFLQELSYNQESYVLYCGSQSTIYLNKYLTFHAKLKHIDGRYH
ncbi:hypothetical protein CR513_03700, partial [Mucuna pruriens]